MIGAGGILNYELKKVRELRNLKAQDSMQELRVRPLLGIEEIEPGIDLGALIGALLGRSGIEIDRFSVVAVAQKIVSKAERRLVYLDEVIPSARALELAQITCKAPQLIEMILRESTEVLRAQRDVLIVRHRLGYVVANAGIDQSNVQGENQRPACLLLPLDPAASASGIQNGIKQCIGLTPAVIITDSFGRPWRRGVVNVALGSAGLPALIDKRGHLDRSGRSLMVTQVALADALAAAAGIVMGEADESVPVAVINGCTWSDQEAEAQVLIRPIEEDLFR